MSASAHFTKSLRSESGLVRDYLTIEDVLAIHAEQIERYGGAHGVRDHGQLEAAIARPQSGYYADLIAEAAALWESLSQNHPFIDGNKRTAFSSVYRFLRLNDADITADHREIWSFLSELYNAGDMKFDRLDNWLRRNVCKTMEL